MVNAVNAPARALDPDVRRFVEAVAEAYLQHPAPTNTAERRALADLVRKPWAEGGPIMARTEEHFAPCASGDVRVRLYRPDETATRTLVYIHGGGWTIFSIDSHDRLMREYAARARVVVVGVDYALAPEAKFPIALEQVVAVVRWLRANGAALGVDASSLSIGGDSAGGNLALAAALALRDAGDGAVLRAVLVNYGAVDDEIAARAHALYGGAGNMLESAEMAAFWRNYLREGDRDNPLARPIMANLHDLPPVFVAIAECDVLAEQNERLVERLTQARVPVEARVYEGAAHSFLEAMSISALARQAIDDGALWLKAALGASAAAPVDERKMAHSRE
ncbi:MAG TPA: alpha/beta hydrolase fold domain-containing protein [Verrucomicrobiae bacterium]|nr:alpha/beta hydrolase fold domain-containing protein [Verrucomicrobiae bacterium]